MKKIMLMGILGLLVLFCAPLTSFSKSPVQIDILYMNHGPMQPTLRDLKTLLPKYKDAVTVSWYDSESKEGQNFMSKMGITRHIPLIIRIDGRFEHVINSRTIRFEGFPTGSGPAFFQGRWTLEDLALVLDHLTGRQ
jgi:hypothetical protein